MPTSNDRDTLVAAVTDALDSLVQLGTGLSEEQWSSESDVPGWTVKDNYSHVIGTELMLLGRSDEGDAPEDAEHVKNDIGSFNEVSVDKRRGASGADVLAELASIADERKTALTAMSDEDFEAETFTPVGKDTYGRFMQIRTFDIWIHEQDCRVPLGLDGHDSGPAVEVALDEMSTALGFVFGKKVGLPEGQSVRLELTGPTARTIDVRNDGRASIVDDLTDPTTTITLPALTWFRLVAGRLSSDPSAPDITVTGVEDLARTVLDNANYTI